MTYQIVWTEKNSPFPLGAYFEARCDYEAVILINTRIGAGSTLEGLKKNYIGKELVKQMLLAIMSQPTRKFSEILLLRNRTSGDTIISLVPKCNVVSWGVQAG